MADFVTLALAKKYTDDSMSGVGAIEGKPCQISSFEDVTEGGVVVAKRVNFLWVDNNGDEHTGYIDVPKGDKGAKGDKGDTGATGPQGEQGQTGLRGEQGLKGDTGAQGPAGADGKSFEIKAAYDTYEDLIEDHPTGSGGDAYFVGLTDNPDLYVWLTDDSEWHNNGPIAGVKGDKGDKGDPGPGLEMLIATQSQWESLTPAQQKKYDLWYCSDDDDNYVKQSEIGSAAAKNYTDKVQPNNHNLVESNAVHSAINQALSSVYVPRGDLTCAELTGALLIEANVGNIYEMSDSGTTTNLFLQGAGETINVGDNVGIIQSGPSTFKYNLMANAFDLTDYQKQDLTTPITIGGTSRTTVEGALGALESAKADKSDVNPVGTILAYGGSSAPTGYLLCNGSEVSKTDYADLYTVIGDAFGTASDNTKFCLPDLREATTKGVGLTGKSNVHYDSDGVALGEFVDDRLEDHHHYIQSSFDASGTTTCLTPKTNGVTATLQRTAVTDYVDTSNARVGGTTEVKAVGVNYIIKY